jgi:hypothetical protein
MTTRIDSIEVNAAKHGHPYWVEIQKGGITLRITHIEASDSHLALGIELCKLRRNMNPADRGDLALLGTGPV